MHRRITFVVLSLAVVALMPRARADLAAYLAKPEPVYKWEKRGETKVDGVTITDLHLVSQTWQGIVWEHRVQVYRPEKMDHPRFCTLLNTGGSGSERERGYYAQVAKMAGMPFGVVFNIPNQPLYGGKREDELVVHTWMRFLETNDESWPLHFPMAKAVLKAMDAIQAVTKEAGQTPIEGFLITGASKRGWTTYLVGASKDSRVKAIAPMVIDILNVPAQIPHQIEAFGKPSEQVGDYTAVGMEKILTTPKGKRLMELEDPYSYRDILTMPKLLILGTNDRYWSQDALNLYWDDLKGPKWVLYVPNSGHGLEDKVRLVTTLTAFARAVAAGKHWPKPQWSYKGDDRGADLTLRSDIAPKSARLFRTTAATKDFRDSRWTSEEMTTSAGGFTGRLDTPAEGFAAMFGEATYELEPGRPFTLSTQIRILGTKKRGE